MALVGIICMYKPPIQEIRDFTNTHQLTLNAKEVPDTFKALQRAEAGGKGRTSQARAQTPSATTAMKLLSEQRSTKGFYFPLVSTAFDQLSVIVKGLWGGSGSEGTSSPHSLW